MKTGKTKDFDRISKYEIDQLTAILMTELFLDLRSAIDFAKEMKNIPTKQD